MFSLLIINNCWIVSLIGAIAQNMLENCMCVYTWWKITHIVFEPYLTLFFWRKSLTFCWSCSRYLEMPTFIFISFYKQLKSQDGGRMLNREPLCPHYAACLSKGVQAKAKCILVCVCEEGHFELNHFWHHEMLALSASQILSNTFLFSSWQRNLAPIEGEVPKNKHSEQLPHYCTGFRSRECCGPSVPLLQNKRTWGQARSDQ